MTDETYQTGIAAGYRHVGLGTVASTNEEAARRARAGDPGKLWITAERQTTGKGRRGRNWVSEPGNLYASLLLIDPAPPAEIGTLPLVPSRGVYEALRPLFSRAPQALAIKWPNDLLVDGAKINGILLESQTLADGRMAVVIGCGINCAHHPADTLYPATDLKACGFDVTPDQMFARLAKAMADVLERWDRGRGFADIRESWLRAARGIGEPVRVNMGDRTIKGRFVDLDARGNLLVKDGSGEILRISAGDLFFSNT